MTGQGLFHGIAADLPQLMTQGPDALAVVLVLFIGFAAHRASLCTVRAVGSDTLILTSIPTLSLWALAAYAALLAGISCVMGLHVVINNDICVEVAAGHRDVDCQNRLPAAGERRSA